MTKPRRILFVCMQNSPHAGRWINNLAGRGWDLHLFPLDHQPVLPTIENVTVHRPFLRIDRARALGANRTSFARWWKGVAGAEAASHPNRLPHETIFPLPISYRVEARLSQVQFRTGESKATSPLLYGPWTLARLISKLKPELIHSMEFQHCGYNVLAARRYSRRGFPPWLATNWGSDIFHFRQEAGHYAQIQRLLKNIDFYSCECHRDIDLAREMGLTAKALPVMPNSGGFELAEAVRLRSEVPTARRRVIMLKGYQHFVGRALTALAALERCADVVKDFEVVIFAPSPETIQRANELSTTTPIKNITVIPFAPHDEMLRMHARARVYLGVSVSDAISTSALEAMAMGAFPIQTNTSCIEEWFEHGKGGYLIPPDDVDLIAQRVRSALTDDQLVEQAAAINWQVIESRLDERKIVKQVWAFYDEIFADLDGSNS